jgi:hypothetical protein
MGRLYAKLEADDTLGRLLLPLLADLLASSSAAIAAHRSSSSAASSIAALALPLTASLSSGHEASSSGAAAGGPATPAEVAGAVVCALEGMAGVCVQRGRDQWLYGQALQLLLTMYRDPGPVRSRRRALASSRTAYCSSQSAVDETVLCLAYMPWPC